MHDFLVQKPNNVWKGIRYIIGTLILLLCIFFFSKTYKIDELTLRWVIDTGKLYDGSLNDVLRFYGTAIFFVYFGISLALMIIFFNQIKLFVFSLVGFVLMALIHCLYNLNEVKKILLEVPKTAPAIPEIFNYSQIPVIYMVLALIAIGVIIIIRKQKQEIKTNVLFYAVPILYLLFLWNYSNSDFSKIVDIILIPRTVVCHYCDEKPRGELGLRDEYEYRILENYTKKIDGKYHLKMKLPLRKLMDLGDRFQTDSDNPLPYVVLDILIGIELILLIIFSIRIPKKGKFSFYYIYALLYLPILLLIFVFGSMAISGQYP